MIPESVPTIHLVISAHAGIRTGIVIQLYSFLCAMAHNSVDAVVIPSVTIIMDQMEMDDVGR